MSAGQSLRPLCPGECQSPRGGRACVLDRERSSGSDGNADVRLPATIADDSDNAITDDLDFWFRTQSFDDPRVLTSSAAP